MALAILCVRCLLGSLFGGGVTAFCFSITGGLLALAVMALARRLSVLSVYGVSILGRRPPTMWARSSWPWRCCAPAMWWPTCPFLLLVAIATGFLTGAISSALFRAMLAADLPFLSQGGPSC